MLKPPSAVRPTVTEIRFEGIPERMSGILHGKYDEWLGEPLDMEKGSRRCEDTFNGR